MRYARVHANGAVEVIPDGDGKDVPPDSLDTDGITVWYDENASGGWNWQAQRLLRDRLMPEDRICGPVVVTGLGGVSIPDDVLDTLKERYEQHTH